MSEQLTEDQIAALVDEYIRVTTSPIKNEETASTRKRVSMTLERNGITLERTPSGIIWRRL